MRKPKPFAVGDNVRLFRKLLLTKDRECLQVGETGKVLDVSGSGLRIYVQFDNDFGGELRPGYGHGRLCSHEELEVINSNNKPLDSTAL